ncbi:HPr family phosphocarrier protein [Maridesulfovibrio hydrothermalis]|uniref:Phosphocarrier protein HPr n=1 Tax=Maridesulfovibrio hydrothermalis AM13 = DSM 14728 TaxID=1121451 RepID=L0R9I8_9BACT|nr:HPr family phosphocarrier protein [Maridesulfovibrio hydrothermalis]CCO23404.1 phosphohistidinoprotein-hexose phosphotransferase component of PTS system (Hpr) [Maridesulfovibrio hydrothermalis AM13 = DSM 14728]
MAEKTITIQAEDGLHVRPASEFVKMAKGFESDIKVTLNGKSASAKSLFKLQLLELVKGAELLIEATGSDEQEAVETLSDFLVSLK